MERANVAGLFEQIGVKLAQILQNATESANTTESILQTTLNDTKNANATASIFQTTLNNTQSLTDTIVSTLSASMNQSSIFGNSTLEEAAKLAKGNPCLVPGTKYEYYDCCNVQGEKLCLGMGIANAVLLGQLLITFIYLMTKSRWFRAQWLLIFTIFFQGLVLIWRLIFLFSAGHEGSSKEAFMILRALGPGDSIVALTAFAIYMQQLMLKYEKTQTLGGKLDEIEYKTIKQTLLRWFWIFFFVYGAVWSALCYVTLIKADMIYIDLAMSVALGGILIYFMVCGIKLIATLQEIYHSGNLQQDVPGQGYLITIIVLNTLAIFGRMVCVSYEDIAKLEKIKSMNAGTGVWEAVLISDMVVEIFSTCTVFLSVFLIYKFEYTINLQHWYKAAEKQDNDNKDD